MARNSPRLINLWPLDSISNWNSEMLVFEERGKPEHPEKNLLVQGQEPTTNSTHIWHRVRESNPRHIGGRPAWVPTGCRRTCHWHQLYILYLPTFSASNVWAFHLQNGMNVSGFFKNLWMICCEDVWRCCNNIQTLSKMRNTCRRLQRFSPRVLKKRF